MNDWNTGKPFGFLETLGRQSIGRSFQLDREAESRVPKSDDEKLCIALLKTPEEHAQLSPEAVRRLVFLTDCEFVRGISLRAASRGFDQQETSEVVSRAYNEVLSLHFGLAQHFDADTVSRLTANWLEELVSITRECEMEHHGKNYGQHVVTDKYNSQSDLFSDDPATVGLAVTRLDKNGVPPPGFLDRCKELLGAYYASPRLTMTAIRPLVWYVKGNDRHEVKRLLAAVVSDESCEIGLRDAAYQALFEMDELPVNSWPEVRKAIGDFSFPEDIDWRFVNKFILDG